MEVNDIGSEHPYLHRTYLLWMQWSISIFCNYLYLTFFTYKKVCKIKFILYHRKERLWPWFEDWFNLHSHRILHIRRHPHLRRHLHRLHQMHWMLHQKNLESLKVILVIRLSLFSLSKQVNTYQKIHHLLHLQIHRLQNLRKSNFKIFHLSFNNRFTSKLF